MATEMNIPDEAHERADAIAYHYGADESYVHCAADVLTEIGPLLVATELERIAETLHTSCSVDDLLGTAEAAARNGVRNELLSRASELRGED